MVHSEGVSSVYTRFFFSSFTPNSPMPPSGTPLLDMYTIKENVIDRMIVGYLSRDFGMIIKVRKREGK